MSTTARLSSGLLRGALLPLGAGFLVIAGCGADPDAVSECVSSADCALGFTCIDGACTLPMSTSGSLGGDDAGSSNGYDAGHSYDAGHAGYDAGHAYDAGSAGSDAGAVDAGGICGAAACLAYGAQCGDVIDDCGVSVGCGDCDSGYRCGTGAFANRCQCEPLSCDQLDAQCGRITDNCGVERECGGCGNRERCSNNQCECIPRTCDDAGAECGEIDDGCGGKRNCGGCTSPERCGGQGVQANQCGCTSQTQATSWTVFTTAQNVDTGGLSWEQRGDGVQFNRQGTNVRFKHDDRNNGSTFSRSDILWLRNAGLNVPSDATVRGIEIQIDIKRNGQTPYLDEFFLYAPNFDSRSLSRRLLNMSTSYRRFTFGGATDRWGISSSDLTPSQLNSANFGVRLSMDADVTFITRQSHPFVDAAQVRVHYTVCR